MRTVDGPVTVDVRSGRVLMDAAGAVPDGDWSSLFQTEPDGTGTSLRTLDPTTGAVVSSVTLKGSLSIRAVAGDGTMVALAKPPPAGTDVWTPVPRKHTTIVVADPSGGNEPETLPAGREPRARGLLQRRRGPLRDPVPAAGEALAVPRRLARARGTATSTRCSAGSRRGRAGCPARAWSRCSAPDGRQLYTLYSSQPAAYAQGYDASQAGADGPVAFVHILNLEDHWAFCLPLPKVLWDAPAGEQAMAASLDGSRLYVVDPSRDTVTVVGAMKTKVLRTGTVDFATDDTAHAAAAVSPDGATLYVGTGEAVVALDTATLKVLYRWPTTAPVTALATSADGASVYAAFADHIDVLDPSTGAVQRSIPVAGALAIEHVAPAA